MTGPLDREFAEVRRPVYTAVARAVNWAVGRPVFPAADREVFDAVGWAVGWAVDTEAAP